ncbi:hypothetical protein Tco_0468261 [Tanacetum coccineum]
MVSDEGTVKTTPLPKGPRGDKDSKGLKPPADMEPLTNLSDDQDVFEDGENMDEYNQADEEEHQSLLPNKEQPESSHAQESDSDSSFPDALRKYDNILPLIERQLVKYLRKVSRVLYGRITEDQWAQHEEDAISYADLRAFIEGYCEENVDHRDQTDKLVQGTMNCLDKNSTERADLLKALNGVTKTLKVV